MMNAMVNSNHISVSSGYESNHTASPNAHCVHKKPIRLKNVSTNAEAFDSLSTLSKDPIPCTTQTCLGSLLFNSGRALAEVRKPDDVFRHAKDFLDQYFTSTRKRNSPAHVARWEQVKQDVETTGTYQLTETELIYGAKLAWRNAARCIGRIQWSKLQVFDCRYVTTTSGMFEALCNHIKYSTNKGNIRSAITVFPQRTDVNHDFRVWNSQLVSYAGYREPDGTVIGDPMHVEFTDICIKLGWKSPRTRFDILPLLLSANGHDPDYFDIPKELILEVALEHPNYKWFGELGLKWYVLPAVSNMAFDCGGLVFTAAPFNGWYMSTEIGCRNLCDTYRYNLMETVATKMGLDTRTSISLWRDKAMVECNLAVLHSFQMKGVTIMDHHTASESFIKHHENEVRLRNGCPADWVWIVPPLSGSATAVFHQEMALYYLRPSYEYQEPAWKSHVWKKGRDTGLAKKPRRKFHFKQIARAVKFTSKLFGRALSRRIKATVLYATETGRSESYAKKLVEIFGHAFNAQVYSMSDYDISSIEHEALLLVITSTFGNGDPPENGEEFAKNLYALKLGEQGTSNGDSKLATSKSFIKANSQSDMASLKKLDREDSKRGGSVSDPLVEDNFGPLSNIRFAVFALGSSAYPNFCAFGKYVDNLLGELGGERMLKLATGDEMCGQEQAFKKWAPNVFRLACETFCLDDDDTFLEATLTLETGQLSSSTVRFVPGKAEPLRDSLQKCHNKKIYASQVLSNKNLHSDKSKKTTVNIAMECKIPYTPGDHLGVYPANNPELVENLLQRLGVENPDEAVELQTMKEKHTSNGVLKEWNTHEKIPTCSPRELLTSFLDITTPPTPFLLQYFASIATESDDQKRLNILVSEPSAYEDWRHWRLPTLLEVLEEFPSVEPFVPLLVAQLNILQPRFYSISSSSSVSPNQVDLTVAVVEFKTQEGKGPLHLGVCSNYLMNTIVGDDVYMLIRSAPNFYLPDNLQTPVVMVGPGTGIAPFRGFWQQLASVRERAKGGKAWLFVGARTRDLDLYKDEQDKMVDLKVIDRVFLALSRESDIPKTYVQDLMLTEAAEIYRMIVHEKGHFYVCGDVTMAEHVYQTLKNIVLRYGGMNETQTEAFMLSLRDENRYHEDVFGITLRTAEIHKKSRESARIRMASEP